MSYDLVGKRIFIAGHRGMVGSGICRRLASEGCQVVTVGRDRLDLRDQAGVRNWMALEKPQAVVIAAAKVGGIHANDKYPAEFIYENLIIETNLIEAGFREGVEKLVFLGSSCIYPKLAQQPIPEDALLTGPLEPTNEWYALAKIAGVKMCEAFRRQYGFDFISAMPTNLYGPGDNFDLEKGHVIPALIRKAHDAKLAGASTLAIWGTGLPRREFLHVNDAADAIVHLLKTYSAAMHINVGSGHDVTILELAELVSEIVGFKGTIITDPSKPDGTPRKLMDVSHLFASGWRPKYGLKEGLRQTYAWYCYNIQNARGKQLAC
jgi:GDP-L-fucose synthase